MDISLGQVVLSRAGRDKGKSFVVVGDADLEHVLLSDGDLRKLEKPKKKKLKHIKPTDTVLQDIGDKLRSNLKVTNAEIRKALGNLRAVPDRDMPG